MNDVRGRVFIALTAVSLVTSGCAVWRGQSTMSAYAHDKLIATAVKAKFVEDKTVDAIAIGVDSLNGTVALSGFAKSSAEKAQAESIARHIKGVREVRNNVVVRP